MCLDIMYSIFVFILGVLDTHSTSSGTSDMSDYIETLSLTSSHSSSDSPMAGRYNLICKFTLLFIV